MKNVFSTIKHFNIKEPLQKMLKLVWRFIAFTIGIYLISLLAMILISFLASFSELTSKITSIKDKGTWLSVNGTIIASLLGSFSAVYLTLMTQRKIDKEKERQNEKIAEAIIENFLFDEIRENFNLIRKTNYLANLFLTSNQPTQFGYCFNFNFSVFDKVKFDLLKYESKAVKDILKIYKMFRILQIHSDINKMNNKDYGDVRETFLEYTNMYL